MDQITDIFDLMASTFVSESLFVKIIIILLIFNGIVCFLLYSYTLILFEKRKKVRNNTQLTDIKVNDVGGLVVDKNELIQTLFHQKNIQFNEWNQTRIKHYFSNYKSKNLPNFGDWIENSDEPNQIICFIKLIAHFQQKSSINSVMKYLSYPNYKIRKEVIKTVGALRSTSFEGELFWIYKSERLECKLEILKAIAFISSGDALFFLKEIYYEAESIEERKMILEVLDLYNEEGKAFFEQEFTLAGWFDKIIFQHIRNPLLHSILREEIGNTSKKKLNFEQTKNINKSFYMNTS
ncbi:MAG: HEAT repeat domain-containing protein [Moheibacter sp.]